MNGYGRETIRSYEEVNEKIRRGEAVVLTAEEYIEAVKNLSLEKASKEVD